MAEVTGSGKHILIVEDEEPLANSLRNALAKYGYRVSIAENGEEGLADALNTHPDMLIVDILMPKMSGVDLLKALRSDAWGVGVPVVILTNLSADSTELVRAVVDAKPTYYLVKSDWSLREIVEKINSILKV